MEDTQKQYFDRVKDGLYYLKPGLTEFVKSKLGDEWWKQLSWANGAEETEEPDIYALIKTVLDKWKAIFSLEFERRDSHRVYNFVSTCFDARTSADHYGKPLGDEQVLRYLDAIKQLLAVISAPDSDIQRLSSLYKQHHESMLQVGGSSKIDERSTQKAKIEQEPKIDSHLTTELYELLDYNNNKDTLSHLMDKKKLGLYFPTIDNPPSFASGATWDDVPVLRERIDALRILFSETHRQGESLAKQFSGICLPLAAVYEDRFGNPYENEPIMSSVELELGSTGLMIGVNIPFHSKEVPEHPGQVLIEPILDGDDLWALSSFGANFVVFPLKVRIDNTSPNLRLLRLNATLLAYLASTAQRHGILPVIAVDFEIYSNDSSGVKAKGIETFGVLSECLAMSGTSLDCLLIATSPLYTKLLANESKWREIITLYSDALLAGIPAEVGGVLVLESIEPMHPLRHHNAEIAASLMSNSTFPWPCRPFLGRSYEASSVNKLRYSTERIVEIRQAIDRNFRENFPHKKIHPAEEWLSEDEKILLHHAKADFMVQFAKLKKV